MNAITTTALVTALLSVLALALQRQELGRLDEREGELQSEVSTLQRTTAGSAPGKDGVTSGAARSGRRSKPTKPVVVEKVVEQIKALLTASDLKPANPQALVAILPDLLRLVEDCTGQNLADLSALLGDPKKMGPRGSPEDMVAMILRVISIEYDPKSFVTLVERGELSGPEREMWTTGINAWARQDPRGALEWLEKNRDHAHPADYVAVCSHLQNQDMGKTVQILASLDRQMRDEALRSLLSANGAKGPEYVDHAHRVEDEQARRRIMGAGVGAVMLREGLDAGGRVLEGIGDDADRAHATGVAAAIAVDARPKETMDWLLSMPVENDLYRAAVGQSLRVWAHKDYEAAAGWLGELNASPVKDEALRAFSSTILGADPRAATMWAAEIADPVMRASTLETSVAIWRQKDPEAARSWEAQNE